MSSGETFRPTADFHPSLWRNHFLKGASDFKTVDHTATQERHEALKEEVRRMITDAEDKPVQKLRLIDEVQRLGVAYHFEKEIEDAIQKLCPNYIHSNSPDLHTVSLHFRLLRQQGIKISCDVFEKFKDDEGRFKSSLINDVQGMLSLYEAAYMAVRGEHILDEAIAFTTTHLKSLVAQDHVTPKLAEQINHALYRPLRKTLPRLEARWWKDLDFTTKLPYARDRLVELYFWDLGTYFEPQYAFGRKIMTQLNYILSIIDDTYDAYGTLEELSLFTEAVQRWNIEAVDTLPEYMKLIYRTLLDAFNEIEEDMAKQGRSHCVRYAKEENQKVIGAYFVQAKWFSEGYVPTIEEYMPIALTSCAYTFVITNSFLGMGDFATKEVFEWISDNPKVVKAASVICRLLDDMQGHEFEQKRGHVASAIECYTKQHGVSKEEAIKMFEEEVANAWKDINEELMMKPTVVARPLLGTILNLARAIDFIYKEDDGYTHSYLIKDQIASVLGDHVPF
ncbi:alpha-humulene/(-)-(E)-beta-caryophyllene synthase [Citrus sinensis]|uniref:Alpha-humulene/(-)-(E)-beta-caryophyllene synthase n=1 Tax=Citrus sinensis TaxID=2711 RepID=A0ACB8LZD1_CITSI|nr:alpha-humulene/(-)-(E)-beta-caryophyllene synthase [Citrus sinensis]